MFVFLSPDVTDDNSATICSGEANALFTKMLAAIDVDIDDVYITSLLKCLLPSGQAASAEQIHLCSDYLGQQIHLIQPELLVVLGETALRCMLQQDVSLDIVRSELNAETVASMVSGTLQASHMYESVPLFASYSPHELLQQPANKRKAWQDLQQIQKIIHGQDTI
jgi:DNA polymerase